MYTNSILAVSGALFSIAAAVPLAKRDIFWVTETDVAYVTVPLTTTLYVDDSNTAQSHYGHHYHTSTITSQVTSVVTTVATSAAVSPVSSVESSITSSPYVAPTTPSTSAYVAPTTPSTSAVVAPTTSSVYVAPTTSTTSIYVAPTTKSTTSAYVAPTTSTTSVYVAPTTTTSTTAAAVTTTSATSSGGASSGLGASGTSYEGDLTWFADGLGACGWTNGPADHIVAISHVIFDSYGTANPNNNPMCGKYVSITGVDGSQYSAEVVDRCVGCAEGDLDLSEDFFNLVTDNGDGRVHNIKWKFS